MEKYIIEENGNKATVHFLGNAYTICKDIIYYNECMSFFNGLFNESYSLLIAQMERNEYVGGDDEDFNKWKEPLTKHGQQVVNMMLEQGIYDRTVEDLVNANPGYSKLKKVCDETLDQMRIILMEAIGNYITEMDKNRARAASTITGSGVSIWTNSLASALAYTLYEGTVISSQTKRADEAYRKSMAALNQRTTSVQKGKENQVLSNLYYPGVKECLRAFYANMMSEYLSAMERLGKVSLQDLKAYNLERSEQLLRNIEGKSDIIIKGILCEAFKLWPINPNIYNALVTNGIYDTDTIVTADYLGLKQTLLRALSGKCAYANELCEVNDELQMISLLSGRNIAEIIETDYAENVSRINDKIADAESKIEGTDSLKKAIAKYVKVSEQRFVQMSEEEIYNNVRESLRYICSDREYNYLKNLGLLRVENTNLKLAELLDGLSRNITDELVNGKAAIEEQILEQENIQRLRREAQEKAIKEQEEKNKEAKEKKRLIIRLVLGLCAVIALFLFLKAIQNEFSQEEANSNPEEINSTIDEDIVTPKEELAEPTNDLADGDFIIEWKDDVLEIEIRKITGISSGDIRFSDVEKITELDLGGYGREENEEIIDITALGALVNLKELKLGANSINDINALCNLRDLESLYLSDNEINDITALAKLGNLKKLTLSHNSIIDLSPLSSLTNLEELSLIDNKIGDVNALGGLINLKSLELDSNQIDDVGALKNLTQLEELSLGDNQIVDISSLSSLEKLSYLDLSRNRIIDISALYSLKNIETLHLFLNQIEDIRVLLELPKLETLTLSSNPITDYETLTELQDPLGFDYYQFNIE